MTSSFDRWEKDPFFSAAEEIQESADRMESTYRTWIHAKKDTSSVGSWNLDELCRDLQTTLGTTKWQLDELGRAVRLSYSTSHSSADYAKDRHRAFIIAIQNQISKVESSLNESTGKPPLPWVRLDEGERDELALFLSGPSDQQLTSERSMSSFHLAEQGQDEAKNHRRTVSAGADISPWKIVVDDGVMTRDPSSVLPPRKIPSLSGFLNTMESSMSQLKWAKNGYKKLQHTDCHQDSDATLPISHNLTSDIDECYDKSKSCLDGCDDYDKQIYGWYGALQRQLQRSQYRVQYSQPVQIVSSVVLLMCLLVLLAVVQSKDFYLVHSNSAIRLGWNCFR